MGCCVVLVAIGCLAGLRQRRPHARRAVGQDARGRIGAGGRRGLRPDRPVRRVGISCSGGGNGTAATMECTATITPVDHASCYAGVQPDIEDTLSCPELTPALIDMIELCVDATARDSLSHPGAGGRAGRPGRDRRRRRRPRSPRVRVPERPEHHPGLLTSRLTSSRRTARSRGRRRWSGRRAPCRATCRRRSGIRPGSRCSGGS